VERSQTQPQHPRRFRYVGPPNCAR
jgi:hypothetical protein